MSLQVWLPLNKDLHNQGLYNTVFTNYSATINNSGKIGKCYSFNGSSNYLIANFTPKTIVPNEMSFCCWVKLNTINKVHTLFCSRTKTGAGLCVFILSSNQLRFDNMGNTNSATYQTTFTPTFSANQWYHIAVIQTSTHKKLYIDGVLKQTVAKTPGSGSNTSSSNSATKATIGGSGANNATDNWLNGYLNDVRIYNHALSDKEIEEISKGLILHYKLDNIVNPNLLIDSNAPSLTKVNATHNRYLEGASSGSYTVTFEELTDPPEIGIKYGVRQKNTSGSSMHSVTWFSGANVSVSATPYTMSCYVKRISEQTNLKIKFQYGKSPYKSTTQNIINDHEWHKYSWTFTPQTASGQAAASGTTKIYPGGMSVSPGEVLICGWKLEKGTVATPWILNSAEPGYNDLFNMYNTIYDSSGYKNNGTIYSSLTAVADSAKYDYATFISNGATNYIQSPTLQLPGDQITMNFWFKSSNTSPGSNYHIPMNSYTPQAYEMSIYKTGYFRAGLKVNGTRCVANCTSTQLLDGNWHMCSMTYDGTIIKRYVDGVMKSSTSATGTLSTSESFIFGHYGSDTSYYCIDTNISDARIYTTALTEAQIKELYDTSATIDNLGNIHTREFDENSNFNITKTGLFQATEIKDGNYQIASILKNNNSIQGNNLYEY